MSGFEKRNRQKENTSRVKFRKKFFAKSEVAKNYICLLGEINGIGILSTLKSEKSFPFWKTFCISEKEMFPEI